MHTFLPLTILEYMNLANNFAYQVACQPCADLVKHHFVHIFSISMALHCSKKAGSGKGSRVLGSSILQIAEISEHERDELIKKCMVRFHDSSVKSH